MGVGVPMIRATCAALVGVTAICARIQCVRVRELPGRNVQLRHRNDDNRAYDLTTHDAHEIDNSLGEST
ncbi:MAG: hypothetical protein KDA41_19420 [Planctomycetales bacterium]|nr:hypothetical protein [Planctomycetales bacterium]